MGFVRSVRSFGVLCSLVVLLSLLSACGEPEPRFAEDGPTAAAAPTEEPSASPTESAPVPEEEAGEVPAYPSAAQGSGRAAAVAFVRHYFAMIDYASNTGEVAPLRRLSSARCHACAGGEEAIVEVYGKGGRIEGIVQTVDVTWTNELAKSSAGDWIVDVRVENTPHVVVHGGGQRERFAAAATEIELIVARDGPQGRPWLTNDYQVL